MGWATNLWYHFDCYSSIGRMPFIRIFLTKSALTISILDNIVKLFFRVYFYYMATCFNYVFVSPPSSDMIAKCLLALIVCYLVLHD